MRVAMPSLFVLSQTVGE